jgi:23S rRNA-/tRNA-specific pseudouridylate synthase
MSVSFVVGVDGLRPDHVLRARYPQVDRALALALLKQGRIVVDGERATLQTRCRAGQRVVVAAKPERLGPAHQPALSVLHHQGDVLIVDKAAGIAMHEGTGVGRGPAHDDGDDSSDDDPNTNGASDDADADRPLSARLRAFMPSTSAPDALVGPSFLGRLDRPTSGLVVAALSREALAAIEPSWRRGDVRKEYVALVRGRPSSQRIDIPLVGRRPHQRGKGLVEEACTEIHSVSTTTTGPALTLVVAEIFSGRTHQIRRHLKAIGHPIVGDPRYGARGDDGDGGLMLHAWRLRRASGVLDEHWPALLPTAIEAGWPERLLARLIEGGVDVAEALKLARGRP